MCSSLRRFIGSAHPLQQASGVFTDVREARDDVVKVEVAEGGVILALPPHLEEAG